MNYTKESPRITVKIYDSNTEELLITISNRNWMDVGQVFPAHNVTALIKEEFKNKKKPIPKKVIVMVAEEYKLDE
jgi:hypothetical protein